MRFHGKPRCVFFNDPERTTALAGARSSSGHADAPEDDTPAPQTHLFSSLTPGQATAAIEA